MPPYWTVVPFALMLLSIAIIPLLRPHWWESNLHKGYVSILLGGLMLAYLFTAAPEGAIHRLAITLFDYVAFIALLGSLFVISGGIYVRGSLAGTPAVNAAIIAIGSVLASFMGTTGAAMLLIRPILRANAWRGSRVHIVVFFIFLVANIGGLLTPLGDPPLYLGFLKGVPFEWTFRLSGQWLVMVGIVLAAFYVYDTLRYRAELREGRKPTESNEEKLGIEGGLNFVFLACIVATIFGSGMIAKTHGVHHLEETNPIVAELLLKGGQALVMLLIAGVSLRLTAKKVREANHFNYEPIIEVAVLFIGIFITMIPALWILDELGNRQALGIDQPWQFFWATGALSSFLDNAPTYLTFTAAASGLHHTEPTVLTQLIESSGAVLRDGTQAGFAPGALFLKAISCGAVFMGANTYIGNGPNFMVKTIAEQNGVRMPSFFGYMIYSVLILCPLFGAVTLLFFY